MQKPVETCVQTVTAPENEGRRDFIKKGAGLLGAASLMALVPPGVRQGAWAAVRDKLVARLELANDSKYHQYRSAVLDFLYRRQFHPAA